MHTMKVLLVPKYQRVSEPTEFDAHGVVLASCNQHSTYITGAIESLQAEFDALRNIVADILTEEQVLKLVKQLDNWEKYNEPKF